MKKQTKHSKPNRNRPNEFYIHALKSKSPADTEMIYHDHFEVVSRMIIKLGGTNADARDLFQDGLIIIYRKIQSDSLTLTCSFRTYLYRVCRNLWLRTLRKNHWSVNFEELSIIPEETETIEIQSLVNHRKKLLRTKLSLLKPDEKKVLQLFFAGVKMKEIARQMGYASESYAKKKKNIVKNKLISLIKKDTLFGELTY